VVNPTSPLQTTKIFSSPSHEPLLEHQGGQELMDHDRDEDFFLGLDNLEDLDVSTESSRKSKFEKGDECSSHTFT